MPQNNLFIYGVPGSGKTHCSRLLSRHFGLPVVEADQLKKNARHGHSRREAPFLYLGTCQAYRQFGKLDQATAISGLMAVRAALRQAVATAITSRGIFILEGAFLDPVALKGKGKIVLMTSCNEKIHRRHFFKHPEKLHDREQFLAARMVQDYLIAEAKELGIEIIDNGTFDPLQLLAQPRA